MASLKEVMLLFRSSGFKQFLRIARFTLARQRLDARYVRSPERNQQPARLPGKIQQVAQGAGGAQFTCENAQLQVVFLSSRMVRLTWLPGSLPPPYALARDSWPEVEVSCDETEKGWQLAAPELSLLVGRTGEISFLGEDGSLLRQELPPELRGSGKDTAWTARILPSEGECMYGLGDQAGPLNLAGTAHSLWNTDPGGSFGPGADPLYMPLPVYCSQHTRGSYLVFYENSHRGRVQFCGGPAPTQPAFTTVDFERGALQFYFVPGPLPAGLETFTELTGRPELPPLWSLGYHQSRWGYKTGQEIEAVAAGFQTRDMPISAIHLDIDYMDGYRVFTIDQQRFPDLPALSAKLAQQGIKIVTIIDPGVKEDPQYPLYRQGMQKGLFCRLPDGKTLRGLVWPGWSVYPDFTDPKTRAWWSSQYATLLDAGVAGIWHDMNEPTSFSGWGGMALPLATRHNLDGLEGDHLQGHNLYALEMNHAGYQALKTARPERRPWLISRAGWVSQQRYSWKWSGDTESSWDSLRMTIANALGMGLSGQPYTGPDIGGFSGSPTPELYLRWFQMAAFLPFFRTHSAVGTAPREPWVYGEPYTSILRDFLKLRYRLLPYLYSLAWEASRSGAPLVRPLFWRDPQNRSLWDVDDAFLLGDDLLVAPVLQADAASRAIRLPRGKWIDYWTKTVYNGNSVMDAPLKLETIPLLVREGAVLPEVRDSQLELNFFLVNTAGDDDRLAMQLYSDAGDGYGAWRVDRLTGAPDGQGLRFNWISQGDFAFPFAALALNFPAAQPKAVWIDGAQVDAKPQILLDGPFQALRFGY